MNARQRECVAKLRAASAEARKARERATKAEGRRASWMRKAIAAGVRQAEVARAAGVSEGRVSQLVARDKAAADALGTPDQAAVDEAESNRDEPSGTELAMDRAEAATAAGRLATVTATLSGVETVRRRTPYGKRTVFAAMAPVGDVLAGLGYVSEPVRVFLVGDAPGGINATRAWALDELPEAIAGRWRVDDRGHYLGDADHPVCRFVGTDGYKVTIMRAASWFGESDATPAEHKHAWSILSAEVRTRFGAGTELADTPATTGRALWLRTIPEGRGYPVMSDELRELIASTSGQGRIELRPAPAKPPRNLPGFTYLDGRLMYAALTWGMPIGEPTIHTRSPLASLTDAEADKLLRGRGRWLVTATVPADWSHVGLLPCKASDGTWEYPAEPGRTFSTWVDGSEAYLARQNGWKLATHEGITWREGKPLDTWTGKLVGLAEAAEHERASSGVVGDESRAMAARLVRNAVRSLLLFTLGAFAARAHNTTGSVSADTPELVPAEAVPGSVTVAGDQLVYELPGKQSGWSLETAHPEWAATVWARARTRLLDAPAPGGGRVGALHLSASSVVAFSTDALYLAGGPPDWADDGKPGRFRVKGYTPELAPWPASRAELFKLRDEAEAAEL